MNKPNSSSNPDFRGSDKSLFAIHFRLIIMFFAMVALSTPLVNAYDGTENKKMSDGSTVIFYYNIDKSVSPYELTITYATTSYGSYVCSDIEIPSSIYVKVYNTSSYYSVTKIGESAFRNCTNLRSVVIPSTIKSIGANAFQGASNLEFIKIPESVTSIGNNAFYECTKLNHVTNLSTALTISKGSTSYGYAGYYAQTVVNKSTAKVVGDFLFVGDVLESYMGTGYEIQLPESLEGGDYKVGPYSFYRNKSIGSVKFPPHAKGVSKIAFEYNYKLRDIYIDSDLYVYDSDQQGYSDYGTFYSEGPIRINVTYGHNVRSIRNDVLRNCKVASIDIREGATFIASNAFYKVSGVDDLYIPSSLSTSDYSANNSLCYCSPKRMFIEEGITATWLNWAFTNEDHNTAFLSRLEYVKFPSTVNPSMLHDELILYNCPRISISESNPYAKVDNGVLMSKSGSRIIKVTPDAPTNFVVPQNVYVEQYAFYKNPTIESISGLKGDRFSIVYCPSLVSITVDAQYLRISNCPALSELNWTGGTYIGDRSFYNLPSLKTLYVPATISEIEKGWLSYCGTETVYMLSPTPPIGCYYNDYYVEYMDVTPGSCKVLVPPGCASQYNSSGYWHGVEEYNGFIIEQPTADNPSVKAEPASGTTYQWYKFGERIESELNLNANSIGSYAWVKKNGQYVSGNGGVANSSCTYKETFNVHTGDQIAINWEVSSETNYDVLKIYLNNTEKVKASGTNSGLFEYTFDSDMAVTLEISYQKDGSVNNNDDCAYIYGTITRQDFTPIEGATDAQLDLLKVDDSDCVMCRATFTTGTSAQSNEFEVSKKAKLYNGTSAMQNVTWTDGSMVANATAANSLMIIDQQVNPDNLGDNVAARTTQGSLRANTVNLTDASPFYTPEDITADCVTYVRNFKNANWQPLFVPFAMDYSDWSDDFVVAELAGVHMYEDKNAVIEFISVKSGTLKPNTPYVIRALNTGEKTITLNNTLIKALPSDGGQICCSSPRWTYTLKGTYKTISSINSEEYVMSGGSFVHTSGGLNGFRFYLVKSKSNSGYWNAPSREVEEEADMIYIMVDGEVCGIAHAVYVEEEGDRLYYDLNGRVVNNPQHGIYIYNGEKILIK